MRGWNSELSDFPIGSFWSEEFSGLAAPRAGADYDGNSAYPGLVGCVIFPRYMNSQLRGIEGADGYSPTKSRLGISGNFCTSSYWIHPQEGRLSREGAAKSPICGLSELLSCWRVVFNSSFGYTSHLRRPPRHYVKIVVRR